MCGIGFPMGDLCPTPHTTDTAPAADPRRAGPAQRWQDFSAFLLVHKANAILLNSLAMGSAAVSWPGEAGRGDCHHALTL